MRRLMGLAVFAGAITLEAQQPAVFRSGVDLVTVDVAVLDGNGDPIAALTSDRFDVTVDGTPRRVVWAEFVRHRALPVASASPADHFSTNEGAEQGRFVMIAVDANHIRRVEGVPALHAAARFVDDLDPADRVAAMRLNDGGPIQFTTDRASVRRRLEGLLGEAATLPASFQLGLAESLSIAEGSRIALDQVVARECGQPLGRIESPGRLRESGALRDPCPVQVEQAGRAVALQARTEARLTVDALARLAARLGEIEGPKTLVLLSEGLVAEPQFVDLTALGTALQAARVTLYVLQIEGSIGDAASDSVSPTANTDIQIRADGLARLAATARGARFRIVGHDPHPFRRILKEVSAHYLVAFEPLPADRDGRTHRINVRVRRPEGVHASAGGTGPAQPQPAVVRSRPMFQIPAARGPADAGEGELVRLLRNARTVTEVPVRVAAYAFRSSEDGRLHLLVGVETDRAPGNPESTAGFVLVDSRGVVAASDGGVMRGGRFTQSITVPPGRYLLKAAAIDVGGRRGSVERQVDARLAAGGAIQLSDLMIAEAPASPDGVLRPLVVRADGERVVAYAELYGVGDIASGGVAPVVEIFREGIPHPVAAVPLRVNSSAAARVALTADIALGDLQPGAHIASLRLSVGDQPVQQLTRRFVVAK